MLCLFPSVVHELVVKDFENIQDGLVKYAYEENKKDFEGVLKSNLGGWQSKPKYASFDNPLLDLIRYNINEYFYGRRLVRDGVELSVTDMWINITQAGGLNQVHCHPGSDLSGVFYLKTSPNCGNIEFLSPHQKDHEREIEMYSDDLKENLKTAYGYWVPSIEGKIVIFSSSLFHGVHQNRSSDDRISVSFNMKIVLP